MNILSFLSPLFQHTQAEGPGTHPGPSSVLGEVPCPGASPPPSTPRWGYQGFGLPSGLGSAANVFRMFIFPSRFCRNFPVSSSYQDNRRTFSPFSLFSTHRQGPRCTPGAFCCSPQRILPWGQPLPLCRRGDRGPDRCPDPGSLETWGQMFSECSFFLQSFVAIFRYPHSIRKQMNILSFLSFLFFQHTQLKAPVHSRGLLLLSP